MNRVTHVFELTNENAAVFLYVLIRSTFVDGEKKRKESIEKHDKQLVYIERT